MISCIVKFISKIQKKSPSNFEVFFFSGGLSYTYFYNDLEEAINQIKSYGEANGVLRINTRTGLLIYMEKMSKLTGIVTSENINCFE